MTSRRVLLQVWEGEDCFVRASWEGGWTSPVWELPFGARELVPSWNALTPGASWLLIEARVRMAGAWSPWFVFARWAQNDPEAGGGIVRTTQAGQGGELGEVNADVFETADGQVFDAVQVRVTATPDAAGGVPSVSLVAVMASAIDIAPDAPVSQPVLLGHRVDVPALSQRRHVDTFPHWDRGGQSWCSATSTTMVLGRWGRAPDAEETAWVGHDTDPAVVHAVRQVFDAGYGGAGNWAFNTAYAATRGLRAYVTRLRDLTEAEVLVAGGLPLVLSVVFDRTELDGAGYSTGGHLLVLVGFTDHGDPIVHDPASHEIASNDEVPVIYRRDQFEKVWLRRRGGLTYVIHPHDWALPRARAASPAAREPNWR